jgi:ferrochelatase
MTTTDGVLLSAHGTVERVEDIPAFLQNIRRGRPTPAAIVHEVTSRFETIGGSPLLRITREQAAALEARLGLPVVVGMRLWSPTIETALREAHARGVRRVLSLPLAPQSVHVYHAAARVAVSALAKEGVALDLVEAPSWGTEPLLVDAFSRAIDRGLSKWPEEQRDRVAIVLSAHSLPVRVIASGDPYERDFRAMADAVVAHRAEPSRVVRIAFQSQGMDGGEWLGPDLPTTFSSLARDGVANVLVCAIGFLSDHIETLYDLDIEAKSIAKDAGIVRLERAPSLDADAGLIDALEAITKRALAG